MRKNSLLLFPYNELEITERPDAAISFASVAVAELFHNYCLDLLEVVGGVGEQVAAKGWVVGLGDIWANFLPSKKVEIVAPLMTSDHTLHLITLKLFGEHISTKSFK